MTKPINGCIYLELKGQYDNINASSEKYGNTKSRGIVIDIADDVLQEAGSWEISIGCTVYFNQYEDQSAFKRGGKDYAFIKLEDIRGVEDGDTV